MTEIYEGKSFWTAMLKAAELKGKPLEELNLIAAESSKKDLFAVQEKPLKDGEKPAAQIELECLKELVTHLMEAQEWQVELEVLQSENKFLFNFEGEGTSKLLLDKEFLFDLDYVLSIYRKAKFPDSLWELRLDIGGYRFKKDNELREIVKHACEKVVQEKTEYRLAPMNAYDRRIIHLEIQNIPDCASHSEGDGKKKAVVITYAGEKKPKPAEKAKVEKVTKTSDFEASKLGEAKVTKATKPEDGNKKPAKRPSKEKSAKPEREKKPSKPKKKQDLLDFGNDPISDI